MEPSAPPYAGSQLLWSRSGKTVSFVLFGSTPGQPCRLVIVVMLPCGSTVSSSAPWNAQIGVSFSPQPAAAQAGRPSPAIGTAAAAFTEPGCVPRYSQTPNAPHERPVMYTRVGSTLYVASA